MFSLAFLLFFSCSVLFLFFIQLVYLKMAVKYLENQSVSSPASSLSMSNSPKGQQLSSCPLDFACKSRDSILLTILYTHCLACPQPKHMISQILSLLVLPLSILPQLYTCYPGNTTSISTSSCFPCLHSVLPSTEAGRLLTLALVIRPLGTLGLTLTFLVWLLPSTWELPITSSVQFAVLIGPKDKTFKH